VQVQPVPEIAVTVKFVGGSVTVTAPAVADAPAALATVIEYTAFDAPELMFARPETAAERLGVVGVEGDEEAEGIDPQPATRPENNEKIAIRSQGILVP